MIPKSFITTQLKEIIEKFDWETADGRVQAVTIAHQIRADLDRILSSQSSGIGMEQVLKLRARLAKAETRRASQMRASHRETGGEWQVLEWRPIA
jgi:hypothetical protein